MFVIFGFLFAIAASINGQAFTKGKYNINLLEIKECEHYPAAKGPITWTSKLTSINDTDKMVTGTVNVPFPVDDTIDVKIEVRKLDNGVWKRNFISIYKKNLCQAAHEYFKTFAVKLFTDAGVKNADQCPIASGNYELKDYVLPLHLIDVPFFYGKFMSEINVLKSNETVSCVDLHFLVEEA